MEIIPGWGRSDAIKLKEFTKRLQRMLGARTAPQAPKAEGATGNIEGKAPEPPFFL